VRSAALKKLLFLFLSLVLAFFLKESSFQKTIIDTGFNPDINGFRFSNSPAYTGWPFGVCLGMSYLALDYWHEGRPIENGYSIRIAGKQFTFNSLSIRILFKHITGLSPNVFKILSDQPSITNEERNFLEYNKLKNQMVATGDPAPLLLSSDKSGHVVVAYKLKDAANKHLVYVYDPNDEYGSRKERYIGLTPTGVGRLSLSFQSGKIRYERMAVLPYAAERFSEN